MALGQKSLSAELGMAQMEWGYGGLGGTNLTAPEESDLVLCLLAKHSSSRSHRDTLSHMTGMKIMVSVAECLIIRDYK